jgi:ectoine hydroxylase-related dioxygenase (phytanoyl-CoA dioxygenase family)
MTMPPPLALPNATKDLEQAKRDLDEFGLCVLEKVLEGARLGRAHAAIYRAAADDRERGLVLHNFGLDPDDSNQRVWNLLNRDPIFADLAEHPVALALVRHVIGWPALLSNISGNIAGPGTPLGGLHADQIFVPEPWPAQPQGINVAWCIDDFTETNGGTWVLPGSHRWHRSPTASDVDVEMVPVVASAGSVIAFESRIWHRTGPNRSDNTYRAAVFPFYTRPIYRTQENWFLSLDPGVRRGASDNLLTLLGYKSEGFGLVFGRSPQ